MSDSAFDAAFARADRIAGWLTAEQARVLWDAAMRLGPDARVVEIGAHQGRSTVILAAALAATQHERRAPSAGGRLTSIDAFVGGRYGGTDTQRVLERNLTDAGVRDLVDVVAARSQVMRSTWTETFDLLWIDGKHDYWTCSDDLRWSGHLRADGRVLVHDAFSSIGVTTSLLVHALPSGRLRYAGRVGSLATFVVAKPTLGDRWAILAELPWWVRNVAVKVLLRLRIRSLARLMGHDDHADPY